MAINTNAFTVYGLASNSDNPTARATAVNDMMSSFFNRIHSILSKDFTRVDENAIKYTMSSSYYYREAYTIPNSNKYIIIEFRPQSYIQIGSGQSNYDSINLGMYITNSIVTTSTSGISPVNVLGGYTFSLVATSTLEVVDEIYTCNIVFSACCLNFYNDNISLYKLSSTSSKTNLVSSIGKCTINGDDYVVFTSSNTQLVWKVWGKNEVLYYTNSIIIAGSNGTDDSNYIMTMPIYLSSGNAATSQIFKDLKLENALQCPNNACSYGGIYKIGGVDYFAIGNNFLLKM